MQRLRGAVRGNPQTGRTLTADAHEGCPVRVERECQPLFYSGLVGRELVQELQMVWARLEEKAREASGELKLHCG